MKIAIIGAGVVGKASGYGLSELGHDIVFCDTDEDVIAELLADGKAACSPDEFSIDNIDAIMVSVPTPSQVDGAMDAKHLVAVTEMIAAKMRLAAKPAVVIYRSTQVPQTTRNVLTPILRRSGQPAHVAYWPEYLRAHRAQKDFLDTPAIVLSSLEEHDLAHQVCLEIAAGITDNIHWLPLEAAELQKLLHNSSNAVKISTWNWFRKLSEKIGISPQDTEKIIDICTTTAEGLYNPSYGTYNMGAFGGACLPKDINALIRFSETAGMNPALLRAAVDINKQVDVD